MTKNVKKFKYRWFLSLSPLVGLTLSSTISCSLSASGQYQNALKRFEDYTTEIKNQIHDKPYYEYLYLALEHRVANFRIPSNLKGESENLGWNNYLSLAGLLDGNLVAAKNFQVFLDNNPSLYNSETWDVIQIYFSLYNTDDRLYGNLNAVLNTINDLTYKKESGRFTFLDYFNNVIIKTIDVYNSYLSSLNNSNVTELHNQLNSIKTNYQSKESAPVVVLNTLKQLKELFDTKIQEYSSNNASEFQNTFNYSQLVNLSIKMALGIQDSQNKIAKMLGLFYKFKTFDNMGVELFKSSWMNLFRKILNNNYNFYQEIYNQVTSNSLIDQSKQELNHFEFFNVNKSEQISNNELDPLINQLITEYSTYITEKQNSTEE
ncbi:hypothetical protein [Mycoplasma nasistruthionis]|uniref:Lipoprotein n=1 Tax=Mycoplasma nasistruthionis TaxID=353852 RepID=A0A5B7XW34_9MOLU|nr:hypothetical protein [Mycoplasma nasistruthionis]QCZ36790.1 hypothetical protein FG904_02085 [Mycoplasma nasistruthionis]